MVDLVKCPLCAGSQLRSVKHRFRGGETFYLCGDCDLIFIDQQHRLSAKDEKARYQHHQNSLDDPDYLQFLSPAVEWIDKNFAASGRLIQGLDFGSGPTPVLAELLRQRKISMRIFDPYFASDLSVFEQEYDFVVSTEVFEHLYSPAVELPRLQKILRPGGVLVVMTRLHRGADSFLDWWYARDPTHVCFFSEKSFSWIAASGGFANVHVVSPSLVVLTKGLELAKTL